MARDASPPDPPDPPEDIPPPGRTGFPRTPREALLDRAARTHRASHPPSIVPVPPPSLVWQRTADPPDPAGLIEWIPTQPVHWPTRDGGLADDLRPVYVRNIQRPDSHLVWSHREDLPMVAVLTRFIAWVRSGRCMILDRDRSGRVVPLEPRPFQWKVILTALDQARRRQPVRIIVPKYRRHGISTIVQALFYFWCSVSPHKRCLTVAHSEASALEIFDIARIIHRCLGGRSTKTAESSRKIEFPLTRSIYQCETGSGAFTASGWTLHGVHVSELAKFRTTSEQDAVAMDSIENALSQTSPDTIEIIESSGQGPLGVFPERVRQALGGKGSFRCVFVPWMADPRLEHDEDDLPDEFDPPLSGDELRLRELGATDGQLAWRRGVFDTKYPGWSYSQTPPRFGWDFPSTPEECFGQQSGRIFPSFSRERNCGTIKPEDLSPNAYRARFIDWGGGGDHPFVCLWVWIDPAADPALIVHGERIDGKFHSGCPHLIEEMEAYHRNALTGRPVKDRDHAVDSLRIGCSTFRVDSLVYVYRELYVTDPAETTPSNLARLIHTLSGWTHPSGDPDHKDIAAFTPGPTGETYRWGATQSPDERFMGTGGGGSCSLTPGEFRARAAAGAGVCDRARGDLARQFTEWGIPLIGHAKPHSRNSALGEVEDGIALLQILVDGDALVRSPPDDPFVAVMDRLSHLSDRHPPRLSEDDARTYRELAGLNPPRPDRTIPPVEEELV